MRVVCEPAILSGNILALPSKSAAHRLLICAALADKTSEILLPATYGEDITATIDCLTVMGAGFIRKGDKLLVTPIARHNLGQDITLDCGESGSTLRFLLPIVAALGIKATFCGRGRLAERPLMPLLCQLRQAGVTISADKLPLTIEGQLSMSEYVLPGNISSQFISGLLFALPLLTTDGTITLQQELQSAGYVDMTIEALKKFSVQTKIRQNSFFIAAAEKYRSKGQYIVEGDWSNMAFFLTAGAFSGAISCAGLGKDSLQADSAIAGYLNAFGAKIYQEQTSISVSPAALPGQPLQVDLRPIPDLLPILAVLAAFAKGETLFYAAERLRLKESDRLTSVAAMLRDLGGEVELSRDSLRVFGKGKLRGGKVDSFNDHRIVMAAAIAATACAEETIIENAGAINKSYPTFFADYQSLGGKCHVLNVR